ncbi:hypothetical protein KUTeg_017798 [Tegillarca granosa]|uniref:Long-chain-fatty-acid--CoA ligase n=1 Tax=Tegillarca granosa TaxID=220873 RepID=A0ABQ9ELD3_TEGGR|nr:hypothetical protein KUTeg_017798 [Tegillarca granosa]
MSKRNKLLYGLAGSVGAGLAAWGTMFPWFGQDEIKLVQLFVNIVRETTPAIKNNILVIDIFEEKATKYPDYPFIIFEDKSYSYGFVNEMANRVAGLAATWNLKPWDTVAIMMCNEPEFIWTFLGTYKLFIVFNFLLT